MRKLVVFPNDPILAYYKKGEIKARYFNPGNYFDDVHIVSLCDEEVAEEKVKEIVGKAKLKIYPVGPAFSPKRPWLFFKKRNQILRLVKEIKPTVIRTYNPMLNGALATYCGKALGVPTIISLHGDYDEVRKYSFVYYGFWKHPLRNYRMLLGYILFSIIGKFTERYCLQNATKVICVTEFLSRYARKYGAKSIEIIYNWVDTKQFMPVKREGKDGKLTVLCVGRVGRQKNQECLIRSMANLHVNLVLIGQPDLGDDRYYSHLQELAKKLNMAERAKFIKSVPYSEINHYYSYADIFAIATRWEGFCIPVLEAMASALPVVVSNKEPLPEVLGGTGVVVENTPEAFAEAFKELISDPQLRKELGEKARKRALELDGKIMERKETDLYKQLIGKA